MRIPITLRLEADLLAAARGEAKQDSRTLTNLIEVALKRHLAGAGAVRSGSGPKQDRMQAPGQANIPTGRASGSQP